jgi:hypothetical protein
MKKFLFLCAAVAVIAIFNLKCRSSRNDRDPYLGVAVNKAHQKDPPIATQIIITTLPEKNESGTVLFEAALPKEKVGSNMLAILLGDSNKIVLHDDGLNGDKLAGDGMYSTILNVSSDSLGALLRERLITGNKRLSELKNVYRFKGRMEFPENRDNLMRIFNEDNFKKSPADLMKAGIGWLGPGILDLLLPVSASFKQRCLLVTDPAVVTDASRTYNPCTNTGTPGGAWTFGKLMTEMANSTLTGITPSDFVLHWMNTWKTNQTVNGDVIPSKANIQTKAIDTWHTLSGGPSAPLDVNKAPFKLLAIVNRFDLRESGSYGGGTAGEGRFVFCLIDQNCQPVLPNFLVIFEYGVNKTSCPQIQHYAEQWAGLESMTPGSAAYNSALQAITDQFTLSGTNPGKPNQNSLDQLRTNELALVPPAPIMFWELREFHIDPLTHQLFNVTTKREPQGQYNGFGTVNFPDISAFGGFVNDNEQVIIADNMDLGDNLTVSGNPKPFLAGHTEIRGQGFHWDGMQTSGPGRIHNDTARMHISLNTCSGCHAGETGNTRFFNIGFSSGAVLLSPFLTGRVQTDGSPTVYTSDPFLVSDPADRPSPAHPIQWPFNDLERRGRDLKDFLSTGCIIRLPPIRLERKEFFIPPEGPIELIQQLSFKPVTMTD